MTCKILRRLNTLLLGISALALLCVLALPTPCLAQATGETSRPATAAPNSPMQDRGLLSRRPPAGKPAQLPQASSWLGKSWAWLLIQQRKINQQLTNAIKRFKTENPIYAALVLMLMSFTYGVLHAAGPGHGKAVISSYVLANEQTVRRGVLLSFMAALMQAISAITIVGILAVLLNKTGLQIKATENIITSLSWGLVAAVGAWLLIVQLRSLFSPAVPADGHAEHGAESHTHHSHDCAHCDHAHMPDPSALQGAWSWRKAFAIALAVGIRPCTGALLVLIFALTQGLLWAGVLATFAMSLGTALTVSVLAALAVGSREFAKSLAGKTSVWAGHIQTAAGLIGATLVLVLGTMFFIASLTTTAPF